MNEMAEPSPLPAPLVVGERTGQEPPNPLHTASAETRRAHDLLGGADVPVSGYWGIHSQGAVANFPIPGVPVGHFPDLVQALALVKLAAARANRRLGVLPPRKAAA